MEAAQPFQQITTPFLHQLRVRPQLIERRRKVRINTHYLALVRSVDSGGQPWQSYALIHNLSSGGLFMQLQQKMTLGQRVFIVFHMKDIAETGSTQLSAVKYSPLVPHIAVRGDVVRVESQADGSSGIAVAFRQHRFL